MNKTKSAESEPGQVPAGKNGVFGNLNKVSIKSHHI